MAQPAVPSLAPGVEAAVLQDAGTVGGATGGVHHPLPSQRVHQVGRVHSSEEREREREREREIVVQVTRGEGASDSRCASQAEFAVIPFAPSIELSAGGDGQTVLASRVHSHLLHHDTVSGQRGDHSGRGHVVCAPNAQTPVRPYPEHTPYKVRCNTCRERSFTYTHTFHQQPQQNMVCSHQ